MSFSFAFLLADCGDLRPCSNLPSPSKERDLDANGDNNSIKFSRFVNDVDEDDTGSEEASRLSLGESTSGISKYGLSSSYKNDTSSEFKNKKTTRGLTSMGMPYVIDEWHDKIPRRRLSVQVHMLSSSLTYLELNTKVRVSTDQRFLVITFPMSVYMSRPDCAFNSYILEDDSTKATKEVLEIHPKTTARKLAVAEIKQRSTRDIIYEQRIPLPRKCRHRFAGDEGDLFFGGKRFVSYEDGSCHLHVELIVASFGGYEAYETRARVLRASNAHISVAPTLPVNPSVAGSVNHSFFRPNYSHTAHSNAFSAPRSAAASVSGSVPVSVRVPRNRTRSVGNATDDIDTSSRHIVVLNDTSHPSKRAAEKDDEVPVAKVARMNE